METHKDFTEYTDKELEDWLKQYVQGWTGAVTSATHNFSVVIAEIQRRYIKTQNTANERLIQLTWVLVGLTIVLAIIAVFQICISFK